MNYNQKEKIKEDKNQTQLTPTGIQPNQNKYQTTQSNLTFEQDILCPFCLNWTTLPKWTKLNQYYQCPHCPNKITAKTADTTRKMTPEQYALWVFNYRLSGFFSKIDFKNWSKQLKTLGISTEFWNEYKKLKGTYEEPTTKEENDQWKGYDSQCQPID